MSDGPSNGRTHWDGCWRDRGHHDCALAMIERLERERDKYHDALIARHGGEPVALLAELDEAREDAERYRWLRNDSLMVLQSGPICIDADKWGRPIKKHPDNNAELGPATYVTMDGRRLDAAIDAARKEQK